MSYIFENNEKKHLDFLARSYSKMDHKQSLHV